MERNIHFTGIGGIGMSALAQMLKERGDNISGSDRSESPVTDMLQEKGIAVMIGQKAENVSADTSILVYSDAVPADNPERMRAEELGIPQLSYFEMLGSVSEGRRVIAVAGTHGKTTTTAMLTKILKDAHAGPTAVIGSIVQEFDSNYVSGTSDLLILEACEYRRHFLNLSPEILVVNNLEFDHTDYFSDLADVQNAFRALMEKVPAHGAIITDIENPNIQPLLEGLSAPVIDYTSERAYDLQLLGAFNQMNARAAAVAARTAVPSISEDLISKSLREFKGTWRRFEYKGKTASGADVYDDYAHHPTAIKETLRAARERAKGRVFVVFHPHLYSRTRDLFDGFVRSFSDADEVMILPIFAAREVHDGTVSSDMLVEKIREEGLSARLVPTFEDAASILRNEAKEHDMIITMGAGDVYKIEESLIT